MSSFLASQSSAALTFAPIIFATVIAAAIGIARIMIIEARR